MSHTAELIAIGTELLLGNIANTDAQMISEGLSELGINVFYHTVVGDNPERVRQAVDIARQTARIAWQNVIFALGIKLLVMLLGLLGPGKPAEYVIHGGLAVQQSLPCGPGLLQRRKVLIHGLGLLFFCNQPGDGFTKKSA